MSTFRSRPVRTQGAEQSHRVRVFAPPFAHGATNYFTQPVLSLGAHCYYSFELGVSLRTYRLKYTACRPVFLADGSHRSPSSADSLSLSSWRRLHPLRLVHGPRGGRHRWPGTPGPLQDVAHLQRSPPHERKRKMTGSWWTTTRRRLDTVIGGTRGQTRSRGLRHRKLRPILLRAGMENTLDIRWYYV